MTRQDILREIELGVARGESYATIGWRLNESFGVSFGDLVEVIAKGEGF